MCDKGQRQTKGLKGGRKEAKKRVKGEKKKGERKQQRKIVALETARPHQNLRSDADGRDEQRCDLDLGRDRKSVV